MTRRGLQNIVIKNQPNGPPPQAETMPPTTEVRTTREIVCRDIGTGMEILNTELNVKYLAETNTEEGEVPAYFLNQELPAFVAEAAITMAAGVLCPKEGETATTVVGNCVLAVSSGEPGENIGGCEPSEEESKSCFEYSDSFVVLHSTDCSKEAIQTAGMLLVKNGLESEDFLAAVNQRAGSDVVITKLALIESGDVAAATTEIMVADGSLTGWGKFFVSLTALAVVGLLAFLFAWHRHVQKRNRRMEDDLKSCRTDWSNGTDGQKSYLEADFRDLALRHSKMNVHKCKSALCEVCRPSLGQVHMLSVPRGVTAMDCDWEKVAREPEGHFPDDFPMERPSSGGSRHRAGDPLELESFPATEMETEAVLPISPPPSSSSSRRSKDSVAFVRIANAKTAEPLTVNRNGQAYKHVVL